MRNRTGRQSMAYADTHDPSTSQTFQSRPIPKRIHGVLKSGAFNPVYGGPVLGCGQMQDRRFPLVANQEGNQRGVQKCGRLHPQMRDIVGPLVPPESKPPPDPSDMPNLELKGQTNFSFMDG